MPSAISNPYEGLPLAGAIVLGLGLAVIAIMLAWTAFLFVRGLRAGAQAPAVAAGVADRFCWVFLVPALNEEVTIADSVERLLALDVGRRRVVVIDDGSDDRTPEILAGMPHPGLHVIRRDPPNARVGKAATLNHAYRELEPLLAGEPRDEVIVAVVDADGRLSADGPAFAASHFEDPMIGGVQSLVRIYNRQRLLTWFQDLEFAVYGHLFQAGRNQWGTAGMGGNGQYNRLTALDAIADETGPWKDKLTEDQDLGLRLLVAGWDIRQELRGAIHQQGLSSPRPLFRQRTRWSQGNLQAMSLAARLRLAPYPRAARAELLLYLLMPIWQGIVLAAVLLSLVFAATGVAPYWAGGPTWWLAVVYLLGFGGTVMGCIAARAQRGPAGWLTGFLLGHPYALYTWTLWPVLARSTFRQLTDRDNWAKTEREPITT